jgi:hypothetical protein
MNLTKRLPKAPKILRPPKAPKASTATFRMQSPYRKGTKTVTPRKPRWY